MAWSQTVFSVAQNVVRYRWRRLEFPVRISYMRLVVDQHYHPHADAAGVTQQWRAVDPPASPLSLAVIVGSSKPSYFRRYAAAFGKGLREFVAYAGGATDAGHERRL